MQSYNIKFPLNDDTTTNTFFQTSKVTKDAFSSDLLLLLLTQKGERYYDPNYGTDLLKFIFEPNDQLTAVSIEEELKQTVSLYIPNLKITAVNFSWDKDDYGEQIPDTQLNVSVKFVYSQDAFSEQGSLDLKF